MHAIRKLPIGIQSFEELRTEGYLYVDKTDLIYKLVTEGKQYFLSRPRRFGKSLLTTTLQAYFGGKKDFFKGLAIEKLETEWEEYPVLYLDFAGFNFKRPGTFEEAMNDHLETWEKSFGVEKESDLPESRFRKIIRSAREKAGKQVVLLVDEYDKPLLETEGEERERIRSTLKGFYGNLKSMGHFFRFAWLTGVTKFAKVSIFSDLNQLNVISMDEDYAALCGLTQEEIETTFGPEIEVLAKKRQLTREACLDNLRKMYDGYRFHPDGDRVYNPFSLLQAFKKKEFGTYWFDSATPSSLIAALQKNAGQLRELPAQDEIIVSASTLTSAYEDNNDPLTYLFQSGYLTIKSYDAEILRYTLDFPNDEVRYGFLNALIPYVTYKKFANGDQLEIDRLTLDFKVGNTASIMDRLQRHLAKLPYHEGPDAAVKAESVFRNVVASIFLLTGSAGPHGEAHVSGAHRQRGRNPRTRLYLRVQGRQARGGGA